jgi:TRAP-type C4-dicarboxylate transport system permease small subunit
MVEVLYHLRILAIRRPQGETVNHKGRPGGEDQHYGQGRGGGKGFGMKVDADSADLPPGEGAPAASRLSPIARAAYLIGSAGLLFATATDALAVAGRHLGFRLLGSIELVQVSVVLIAASAMVAATIVGAHASVHIVTERLPAAANARLVRAAALLSAATFAIFALGSAWVASDLWSGFEQTELLGLPLRWFRALWIAAAALIALLFLRAALRRAR